MPSDLKTPEIETLNVEALPPWQPTFLARYPRNIKLAFVGTIFAGLFGFWFLTGGPLGEKIFPKTLTVVRAADTESKQQETQPPPAKEASLSATDVAAPSLNDQDDHSVKMIPAPDPGLTEDTAQGSLPRIGDDGRTPWQSYARPFNAADRRPRIAFIISGLGMSRSVTDAAISRLPVNVTLAFDVLSPVAGAWCGRARQVGHEVLLQLPMEPFDYPRSDPGPNTLLTTLPASDNVQRLLWGLRQGTGYVGITTLSGSRFTSEAGKLTPILEILKSRGLMMVDARVAPHSTVISMTHDMGVPATAVTLRLDQDLTPESLDAAFVQLEQTARLTGRAIGLAPPLPFVLDKLQIWLKKLPQRGFALAPVSAMAM